MVKAIDAFSIRSNGMRKLVNAADLYLNCLLFNRRGQELKHDFIHSIAVDSASSFLTVSSDSYSEEDIQYLQINGNINEIGQQILFSSYTSFEIFLIDKFKELLEHVLKNSRITDAVMSNINFRSLENIKKAYAKFFKVEISKFDVEFYVDNKSSFKPRECWEALVLISKSRNEIAHEGISKTIPICTLVDVMNPVIFIDTWVTEFDLTFNFDKHSTLDECIAYAKECHLLKN
jgi:hypothetical protein